MTGNIPCVLRIRSLTLRMVVHLLLYRKRQSHGQVSGHEHLVGSGFCAFLEAQTIDSVPYVKVVLFDQPKHDGLICVLIPAFQR